MKKIILGFLVFGISAWVCSAFTIIAQDSGNKVVENTKVEYQDTKVYPASPRVEYNESNYFYRKPTTDDIRGDIAKVLLNQEDVLRRIRSLERDIEEIKRMLREKK